MLLLNLTTFSYLGMTAVLSDILASFQVRVNTFPLPLTPLALLTLIVLRVLVFLLFFFLISHDFLFPFPKIGDKSEA